MTADVGGAGVPRFDVVLRGYDRRQVDEHVARLQRVMSRMRADLEMARSQPIPVVPSHQGGFGGPGRPPAGPPRPGPRPRPGPSDQPDMIGSFTDRMQSILQAAEEEAAEIRNKARAAAHAEVGSVRAELADLVRQRDAARAELTRLRGQVGEPAASPPRASGPPRDSAPEQGRSQGQPPGPGSQAGRGGPPNHLPAGASDRARPASPKPRPGPGAPGDRPPADGPAVSSPPQRPGSPPPSSQRPGSQQPGSGQPGSGQRPGSQQSEPGQPGSDQRPGSQQPGPAQQPGSQQPGSVQKPGSMHPGSPQKPGPAQQGSARQPGSPQQSGSPQQPGSPQQGSPQQPGSGQKPVPLPGSHQPAPPHPVSQPGSSQQPGSGSAPAKPQGGPAGSAPTSSPAAGPAKDASNGASQPPSSVGTSRGGLFEPSSRVQESRPVEPRGPGAAGSQAPAPGSGEAPTVKAAHRLPTGAYPAVTEQVSLRSPSEPEPEPGALFRPVASDPGRRNGVEAQAQPVPKGAPERPSGGSDVQATVKVKAVRPAQASDATVVSSLPAGAEKKDSTPDAPADPNGAAGKTGEAGRTTSATRTG